MTTINKMFNMDKIKTAELCQIATPLNTHKLHSALFINFLVSHYYLIIPLLCLSILLLTLMFNYIYLYYFYFIRLSFFNFSQD